MKRLILLSLLLAGCVTAPTLEPADSPEQARALEAVERVTGMRFKGPVPVYHFSPGAIRGHADYSDDSVIGFYDTDAKRLFLTREAVGTEWYFGLRIHEATHALQDQLYDLAALDASAPSRDAYNALQALIEGHAECVMLDVVGRSADALVHGDPGPKRQPTSTDMLHAFHYSVGLNFVQGLKARGGYAAVDAAFRMPPASSEQVMHPAKYPAELPDVIELDLVALQAALPGWTLDKPECLGELGVLTRLVVNGNLSTAGVAAAGWGGDVAILVTRGDSGGMIWVTTWDTTRDALEYHAAASGIPETQAWLNPLQPRMVVTVLGDVKLADIAPVLLHARVRFHQTPLE